MLKENAQFEQYKDKEIYGQVRIPCFPIILIIIRCLFCGFFVYNDTLIINDYEEPFYDEEKNIWLVEIEDEYIDMKDDVVDAIERCNELLKNDVCKKAVVLIDKDLYEEHPNVKYESIDFLPVSSDLDVEAIKTFLSNY